VLFSDHFKETIWIVIGSESPQFNRGEEAIDIKYAAMSREAIWSLVKVKSNRFFYV
jgi:hypothetical protein